MSLRDAIESRHAKDLIVAECKNGPTHSASHLRLDYWVLRRSWANPAMIGYEVKSSRADFLRDEKWRSYLPLCNELWFIVTDPRAIAKDELPESVGLLRLAGSRLVTVKRAVWRDIPFPGDLMTYILMCRARVAGEHQDTGSQETRLAHWRRWLATKAEAREVGREVAKQLRQKYANDVESVRCENQRLQKEVASFTALRDALKAKGIEWSAWHRPESVEEHLRAPHWARYQVEGAHKALAALLAAAPR